MFLSIIKPNINLFNVKITIQFNALIKTLSSTNSFTFFHKVYSFIKVITNIFRQIITNILKAPAKN